MDNFVKHISETFHQSVLFLCMTTQFVKNCLKKVSLCYDQCQAGWPVECLECQKLERHDCLGHCKCDKRQTVHGGATNLALPIYTTFSDFEYVSRSLQGQTFLTEKIMFLIQLLFCFVFVCACMHAVVHVCADIQGR